MEDSHRQSGSFIRPAPENKDLPGGPLFLIFRFLGIQNAELVTLTYGSIVAQLCKDYEGDYLEVNKQLEKMGYNIGLRLIEDFLAKTNMGKCANFRETAETISKVCSHQISRALFPPLSRKPYRSVCNPGQSYSSY